jgi:hypothetical protein
MFGVPSKHASTTCLKLQPCREVRRARRCAQAIPLAAVLTAVSDASGQPALNESDVLIASRSYGTILGPISGPPGLGSLITGRDLSVRAGIVRGNGPSLTGQHLTMLALNTAAILARPSAGSISGIVSVAVATGDRTPLPGTTGPLWTGGGDMIRLDRDHVLVIADDFEAGTTGKGKVLKYNLLTSETTLITGPTRGEGVVLHRPRAMTRISDDTIAVVEFGAGAGLPGALVYLVDIASGDRTVISSPGQPAPQRFVVTNGVLSSSPVSIPRVGTGPVTDGFIRGIAAVNAELYICGSLGSPFEPYIMRIAPLTGLRTVLGGTALNPVQRVFVPFGEGSTSTLPDAPCSLQLRGTSTLLLTATFGTPKVWAFDTDTRRLTIDTDLEPLVDPTLRGDLGLSSLSIVPKPCAVAPSIAGQPEDVYACASTTQLSVSILGEEPALFRWRADGVPIDWLGQPSAITPTLLVSTIARPQTTFYDCVVTNECGSVTTRAAEVVVCRADVNCDRFLDFFDYDAYVACFESGICLPGQSADFNGDNFADFFDYNDFVEAFETGC